MKSIFREHQGAVQKPLKEKAKLLLGRVRSGPALFVSQLKIAAINRKS